MEIIIMQSAIGYILAGLIGGGVGFGIGGLAGDGWSIFGAVIGFLASIYLTIEAKKQNA